jgi:voltage-gated potassium channel
MTANTNVSVSEQTNYAYQLFMLFLCLYAIAALAIATLVQLPPETARILEYADWVVCGLFLFDFGRHLAIAGDRWRHFYTWGWIDLLSSVPMIAVLRIGRFARVLRILRVLRALRATKVLVTYLVQRRASSAFYSMLAVSFSMIVFSAVAVLNFEMGEQGSNIQSAEDALWWSVATITTVGYGDRFPVTAEGRTVAVMLMTTGVGLFGVLSGVVATWFLTPNKQEVAATMQERTEVSDLKIAVSDLRELLENLKSGKSA